MLIFNNNAITQVQRQVYTANKSTYTTVSTGTVMAYLRPLSAEDASINGLQFGQAYQLIAEVDVNILVGDKLTIDGGTYTVRGLANHNRGGITAYKKFLLVNP